MRGFPKNKTLYLACLDVKTAFDVAKPVIAENIGRDGGAQVNYCGAVERNAGCERGGKIRVMVKQSSSHRNVQSKGMTCGQRNGEL